MFISAAVAGSRREPYRSYVEGLQQKGIRAEMARLTLARKIAAVALRVWKKGDGSEETEFEGWLRSGGWHTKLPTPVCSARSSPLVSVV